jgi:hypothetical protein
MVGAAPGTVTVTALVALPWLLLAVAVTVAVEVAEAHTGVYVTVPPEMTAVPVPLVTETVIVGVGLPEAATGHVSAVAQSVTVAVAGRPVVNDGEVFCAGTVTVTALGTLPWLLLAVAVTTAVDALAAHTGVYVTVPPEMAAVPVPPVTATVIVGDGLPDAAISHVSAVAQSVAVAVEGSGVVKDGAV